MAEDEPALCAISWNMMQGIKKKSGRKCCR